jgi:hypothetical protein
LTIPFPRLANGGDDVVELDVVYIHGLDVEGEDVGSVCISFDDDVSIWMQLI